MDIFEGLNSRQKEAVTTTEGRIRVVAGAGTGKTKALTHRYAYRWVSAFVLPVPAPATTRILPSVVVTASFCRLFSPSKMSIGRGFWCRLSYGFLFEKSKFFLIFDSNKTHIYL